MKYLVELIDKDPLENIIGTCVFEPQSVIFLCDKKDTAFFKQGAIHRFLHRRKLRTTARFYFVDTNSPDEIRKAIHAIARDFPGCVFDLSGGRDLVLIEASTYCAANNIPCYYINLRRRQFLNIRNCEELAASFFIPSLSAEDLFCLQGATAQGSGHYSGNSPESTFEEDILPIWDIVSQNVKAWDSFATYLQKICGGTSASQLEFPLDKTQMKKSYFKAIISNLKKIGIARIESKFGQQYIILKSELHKNSLTNHGIWLELFTYKTAKDSGFFNDVRTSMLVDWDADSKVYTTRNEIDVFLMKDIVPVFISCKMSVPSPLALSEIKLLSSKFGGKQSKTIVVSAAKFKAKNNAICQRAADLNIALVDICDIQNNKMLHILKNTVLGV